MSEKGYIAGACNIGREEIAVRWRSGVIALALTIGLWVVFVTLRIPAAWRLTLFLPATASAAGFLQAALRFCTGFGLRGVFNFDTIGRTTGVAGREERAKDRRRALRLGAYSVLIGAAIALGCYFTA